MWDLIKAEIKNAIFQSTFHKVRFLGLLIVPFIYGFTYIFAFWNPFSRMEHLPLAIVTQRGDKLGEAVGKELTNTQEVKMGAMDMTIKMEHLYFDSTTTDAQKDDIYNHNHLTIVLPELSTQVGNFVKANIDSQTPLINKVTDFMNMVEYLKGNRIQIVNNFKKSYLLAFGLDMSTDMASMTNLTFRAITAGLSDPDYISSLQLAPTERSNYDAFVSKLAQVVDTKTDGLNIINAHSYMHEHEKYGFGLAPFFISIGLWVGAMVLTMCFHRKPYESKAASWKRYFAKYLLICSSILIQALLLMIPLYAIGFAQLGAGSCISILFFGAFFGMVFASVIQAIRYSIPNRVVGLFICIIFLVIQMASAGGLFPIQTTNGFWRFWHEIIPMTRTVNTFRELAYHPDWTQVFSNIGILLIYPLIFVPIGLWFNNKNTKKFFNKLEGGVHV